MSLLYPHNQKAYEQLCTMLEEEHKACIIHPTGTGKSFIGFQYAAEHPNQRVLWLAPSQYIFQTQKENWRKGGGSDLDNITFHTYAKLLAMPEEEMQSLRPDVFCLDEYHRAGAERWSESLGKLIDLYPSAYLIGLTATNIRYLDGQRDMAQELFDGHIASEMSLGEAIVRGILPAPKYVLSIFKYKDDLAKYELRARKAKSKATRDAAEEILEKLRRALENAIGLDVLFEKHMADRAGKYLVFCANYEHMQEMMAFVPEWFAKVDPHPHVYSAYSDDPSTSVTFADFKADGSEHLKLLFCIDMLNEGIHVDDVSGVILLRPTISPIIYKQQIGRALSSSSTRTPVIFDIVLNIENLYSIGSIEEEMEVAISYYRELGLGDEITDSFEIVDEVHDCLELFDRLNETLTTSWDIMYGVARKYWEENGDLNVPKRHVTEEGYSLGPWLETQRRVRSGKDGGILTPERIRKLDALGMRWESYSDISWEKYYAAARQYWEEHGDLMVRVDYVTPDGVTLGNWIAGLRTSRKSGIRSAFLVPERIAALDELGMAWDVPDYLFERNFSAALNYYRTHGDLEVPAKYVDDNGIRLGVWLSAMRQRKRLGRLTYSPEQIERLNSLGMRWTNQHNTKWENGFEHAKEYVRAKHSLLVPPSYVSSDGFKLGDWVANQREKYRAGSLSDEQRVRLEEIGMPWELPSHWEVRYALAERYFQENGNLNVQANYIVDGVWLGRWLDEQKKKKDQLTPEQIERLDALGMNWTNRFDAAWDETLEEAKAWLERAGEIPKDAVSRRGNQLRKWFVENKRKAAQGKLSPERTEKINSIKIPEKKEINWLEAAADYQKEHGSLEVPPKYVTRDGLKLGDWIDNIRKDGREKLSNTDAEKLDALGMRWMNKFDREWEKAFRELEKFVAEHGNANMPFQYTTESGFDLERWLYEQRKRAAKDRLRKDRKEKLDRLAPDWQEQYARRAIG